MNGWVRSVRNEKGVALPLALFVLVMLTGLLATLLAMAGMEPLIAQNHVASTRAFYIAEAGIEHTLSVLPTTNIDALLQGGGILFNATPSGGGSYTVRVSNNLAPLGTTPPDPGGATDDTDGFLVITSTGTSANATRVIEAVVTTSLPLFDAALIALASMDLAGGNDTDSFDSRLGPYNPATAGNEGSVRSNGGIKISGGVGNPSEIKGNVTAVGKVTAVGNVTVTGTVTEGAPPLSPPPVAPCGPWSGGSGITTTGSYDPATGALQVTGGKSLTLAGGTYCFSSIQTSTGATLTVTDPVTIYVNGKANFAGGVLINNTTLDASKLALYSSSDQDVHISSSGVAYMTVYAPQAYVNLSGGNHFYGAAVGKTVHVSTDTKFHYDLKLRDGPRMIGGNPKVLAWREL